MFVGDNRLDFRLRTSRLEMNGLIIYCSTSNWSKGSETQSITIFSDRAKKKEVLLNSQKLNDVIIDLKLFF